MPSVGILPTATGRLPTYRRTHLDRFHPYPMESRIRDGNHLMATVDRRSAPGGLEPIIEEPEAVTLGRPLVIDGELPDDSFSCDVSGTTVIDDFQSEYARHELVRVTSGHRKFVAAFVNMMFALRRRSAALFAVPVLPKVKEAETK